MSNFTVSNGKILDPNGNAWHGEGVAIFDDEAASGGASKAQTILNQFPGVNLIRVANYTLGSPSSYQAFVNTMSAAHVLVIFEDHNTSNSVLSGSALTNETNWYGQMASFYASNPYVGFSTMNEPGSGDGAQQQAIYNAVRGAGSNALVDMEAGSGADGNAGTDGNISAFANDHNIAWDIHAYDWQSGYSTDVNAITNDMNSRISAMQNSQHSADGVMPVLNLEDGNSTNGSSLDPGGSQEIQATFTNQNLAGATAWIYNEGNNEATDNLTNNGASLTAMGTQVAGLIKAGPGAPSGGGTTPPPPPPPSGTASPDGTVITPGSGSFSDGTHTYTLTSGDVADEDGNPIPGGTGTGKMEWSASKVYGQDLASGNWYIWNQSTWTAAAAPTTTSPPPPSGTTSPDNTVVHGTTGSIVDKAGQTWTITGGGQVAINGTPDTSTANVTTLAWEKDSSGGDVVWQENTALKWYEDPTGKAGAWTPASGTSTSPIPAGSPPPPTPAEALAVATIPSETANTAFTVTGTISNVSSAPTLMYEDDTGSFVPLPSGASVSASSFSFLHPGMAAGTHTVSVEDSAHTAIKASSNSFSVAASGGGASPSGTIITPGHGSFTDSIAHTYTLTSADIATEDGKAMNGGGGTGEMEYFSGKVYGQDASTHNWFTWDQTTWHAAAAPT